jgi:hypothetical protein
MMDKMSYHVTLENYLFNERSSQYGISNIYNYNSYNKPISDSTLIIIMNFLFLILMILNMRGYY